MAEGRRLPIWDYYESYCIKPFMQQLKEPGQAE